MSKDTFNKIIPPPVGGVSKLENTIVTHDSCQCGSSGFCTRYGVYMSDSLHRKCQTSQSWRENFQEFFTKYPSSPNESLSPEGYSSNGDPIMPVNPLDEVPTKELDQFIQQVEKKGINVDNYQDHQEGLGNLISNTLSKMGISEDKINKWAGVGGCGCGKRKKFLNRILPFRKKE